MDERQRNQSELIIAHELDLVRRGAASESRAIFADHSAKGILGSGATVKVVSTAIGGASERLLASLVEKIGNVARTPEAFAMIEQALEDHFANMDSEVVQSARMASRSGTRDPNSSILGAAQNLFDQIKSDLRTKLAIERFAFEEEPVPANSQTSRAAQAAPNKGGKPLAEHWDAMWAEIAHQLYTGKLQPKRQAHITAAMNGWLDDQGIDAGSTAVTDRARALWQRIERG